MRYPVPMRSLWFFLTCLVALGLAACGGREYPNLDEPPPPAPPHGFNDPGDMVLMDSVRGFLKDNGAPLYSEFEFTRTDLNADGRRDALVLFKNPYGFWCGGHGCTMLVMKANDNGFTLVNSVQPIRTPLQISTQKQNGWNTLIARVSGRSDPPRDVALMFDGSAYPQDPSTLPAFDTAMMSGGKLRVFP